MTQNENTKQQLNRFIEGIEKLEEDKKEIAADIKQLFDRAKGEGFDPKVIRQILKIRKMDPAEREEQESLLDIYMHALGMIPKDAE